MASNLEKLYHRNNQHTRKGISPSQFPNAVKPEHHITTFFTTLYTINASLTIFAIMHVIIRQIDTHKERTALPGGDVILVLDSNTLGLCETK
jgi:hypothetical protein